MACTAVTHVCQKVLYYPIKKLLKPVANDSAKHQFTNCSLKYLNKKDMFKHKKFVHDDIHTTYTCTTCEFQCIRKHAGDAQRSHI